MNQKLSKTILVTITLIGVLLFVLGIVEAFKLAGSTAAQVEEFNKSYWSYMITSINGLLTINLGILIGVDILMNANRTFKTSEILEFENIRLIAAILFLVALLVIFIVWATKHSFSETATMPTVIPQIAKTFFALILAVLGVVLAKKR